MLVPRFQNRRIIQEIIVVLNSNVYIKVTRGSIITTSTDGHGKIRSTLYNHGKNLQPGKIVPVLPFSVFSVLSSG